KCTLTSEDTAGKRKELGTADTAMKSAGNYLVRFANIDARLTVWVDRALPFGDGVEYAPLEIRGPGKDEANLDIKDLLARRGPRAEGRNPARNGSKGANVHVTHVILWRDTYYTTSTSMHEWDYSPHRMGPGDWSKPGQFGPLRDLHVLTMYVQPGHYLCMG